MAISVANLGTGSTGSTNAQTRAQAVSATADGYLVVWAFALTNNTAQGLDTAWSISDDASTNSITWTQVERSTRFDIDADSWNQLNVWISSKITDAESFTVTVDPDSGGTTTFLQGMSVVEVTDDGAADLEVVQSDAGGGASTTPDVVFGSTPAGFQLCGWYLVHNGTATQPTAPTGFTKVTGAVLTTAVSAWQLLESSTNTTATVSYAPTTSGSTFGFHAIGIELAEPGGGASVDVGQAAETGTALAVTATAGGVAVPAGQAAETGTGRPVTAAGGAVAVPVGLAVETDTGRPVTATPGAATVTVATAAGVDSARPVAVTAGGVSVGVNRVTETDSARPLAVTAGAVAVAVGQASGTDTAAAVSATAGAVSVTVGQAVEVDSALPVSTAGDGVQPVGQAVETDTARPVTATAGGVSVPVGQASEADIGRPVTATSGTVVQIGQASETGTARPISAAPGTAAVAVGQAVEVDTARPVSIGGTAQQSPIGQGVETGTALAVTPTTGRVGTTFAGALRTIAAIGTGRRPLGLPDRCVCGRRFQIIDGQPWCPFDGYSPR